MNVTNRTINETELDQFPRLSAIEVNAEPELTQLPEREPTILESLAKIDDYAKIINLAVIKSKLPQDYREDAFQDCYLAIQESKAKVKAIKAIEERNSFIYCIARNQCRKVWTRVYTDARVIAPRLHKVEGDFNHWESREGVEPEFKADSIDSVVDRYDYLSCVEDRDMLDKLLKKASKTVRLAIRNRLTGNWRSIPAAQKIALQSFTFKAMQRGELIM